MGTSPTRKKSALKAIVEDCMAGFEPRVRTLFNNPEAYCRIDTRERDWARGIARDFSERVNVMGDPLWYCQILFVGPTQVHRKTVDGQLISATHRFAIMLFLEFLDADNEADASTQLFEDMTDSVVDPCGLLPSIRSQGLYKIDETDATICFMPLEDDLRSVAPVESTGSVAQHVFTTEVAIKDLI